MITDDELKEMEERNNVPAPLPDRVYAAFAKACKDKRALLSEVRSLRKIEAAARDPRWIGACADDISDSFGRIREEADQINQVNQSTFVCDVYENTELAKIIERHILKALDAEGGAG